VSFTENTEKSRVIRSSKDALIPYSLGARQARGSKSRCARRVLWCMLLLIASSRAANQACRLGRANPSVVSSSPLTGYISMSCPPHRPGGCSTPIRMPNRVLSISAPCACSRRVARPRTPYRASRASSPLTVASDDAVDRRSRSPRSSLHRRDGWKSFRVSKP